MRQPDGFESIPPAASGGVSRRSLLAFVTAVSAAALTGCGLFDDDEPGPDADGAFGLWEQLRTSVRASPDHVAAAAERVVAGKDPEAILAFVRDQIVVYPSVGRSLDLVGDTRWGVRGTLRGGAGSARDKVETLADLYRRAGFKAEVLVGELADDVDLNSVFRPVRRSFEPKADEDTIARWHRAIGKPATTASDRLAAVRDEAKARTDLARQLADALPSRRAAEPAASRDRRVPLVKVVVNGKETYANPLVAGAKLGATHTTGEPSRGYLGAGSGLSVEVRLLAATTAEPTLPTTLVKAEYHAEDLIGRQLHVAFRPTAEMAELIHLRPQDLNTFTPTLAVAGPGLAADAAAKLAFSGSAISLTGQVIEVKDDEVLVDGEPLEAPAQADPRAGERVAKLQVDAAGGGFPDVSLRVSAFDAAGKPVTGLPASAFQLAEDQTKLALRLTANKQQPPRVMLVFDLSGSIKTGPEPKAFATELARRLFARNPSARVGVMAVSGGSRLDGFPLRTPEAVGDAVGRQSSVRSGIWESLKQANEERPTVIVIASDFEDDETDAARVAAMQSRVGSGAPIVAIGIGDVNRATQEKIVELTGGVATEGSDVERTVAATDEFLRRQEVRPYQLRYRAPADGPAERTVTLTAGKGIRATATYRVPAPDKRTAASGFAGIYLGVRVGYESEVIRVLAGVDPDSAGDGPLPATAVDEVQGLMFGTTLVSFEGAAPSVGTWLDDLLTARLGTKAFVEAAAAKDEKRLVSALEAGLPRLPSMVPALHPPVSGEGDLTFETGLRAVLHVHRPQFGTSTRVRRADVLPCTRWATLGGDRVRAFDRTLEQSAALALAEGVGFRTSTWSALKGKRLTLVPKGSVSSDQLAALPEASRVQWRRLLDNWDDYDRLMPADGTPVAFWAVEPDTGSMLGVLADGSGGGASSDPERDIARDSAIISLVMSALGLGGFAVGAFVAYGKAISAQMRRYAHVIENLDQPNVAELAKAANQAAIDDVTNAFWDKVTGPAEAMAKKELMEKLAPWLISRATGLDKADAKFLIDAVEEVNGYLDLLDTAVTAAGLDEDE
ncbi:hypothetical protein EV385_5667 [Krasilnikovia cinnamomea]|uniref:VWFA domain-containing protein n=1 Tax=Krasilnikovia cinnamomea TaxID=349313 RepID=A0A4Q7ZSW4_9ACTN|nr:vWA domain-containing protein [Krasilnikovia cinnamomea]RZU53733.1 hypothetical protein EV385_5667 [Krasilnikovia cinnamomea]